MASFRNTYLKDICNFEKGSEGLAKAMPGEYPLVTTGAERRTCESFQFDTKAVCIPLVSSTGHGHASLKNVHYQEGEFALGTILVALTAIDDNELDIQFLHLYLSQLKDIILVPLMSGAANVALSVTKIKNIEIPLPPIEQQKEIVVQFKSIVIEEAELKNELTHQQTLLKKLRQQILQEAIEGKLTEEFRIKNEEQLQIWNDELRQATDPETIRNLKLKIRNCSESAASLLQRIKAEKEQLIKDKKIKKQKALPPVTDEEKPFDLPDGWVWCRLGEASYGTQYGTSSKSLKNGDIAVLRMGNIQSGEIIWDSLVYSNDVEEIDKFNLVEGDLLFNRTNSRELVGKTALYRGNQRSIYAGYLVRFHMAGEIVANYANYVMNSLLHSDWCNEVKTDAIGQSNINATKLSNFRFPLPPLSEQIAIVSKVEKLIPICDQLETQVTRNQTHAEQLMQAVLKEAFQNDSSLEEVI